MNKLQVITKIESLNVLTPNKLATLKGKQVKEIVAFYHATLCNLIKPLGLPDNVSATLSIQRLETLADNYKQTDKAHKTTFKAGALGLRQTAVINAVNDINNGNIDGVTFPIDIKEFKNIVCGYYASKYFVLNEMLPQNLASVETLFNAGLISLIDGVDEKTVLDQLKKNGYFAGANSYSTTHKNSTTNNDIFTFVLAKDGAKLTFTAK